MWITFTGLYVIVGTTAYVTSSPTTARLLSSAFLTIAGALVLLLICHTVIAADRNASRKTLLVALTACLFFVQKSSDTYHDDNVLIFAIIFSAIILTIVWLPDESRIGDSIMLTSIAVLLAAIAFSGLQLVTTLIEQRLLRWQNLPAEAMVISPHVAGILSGMMSFLVMDNWIARSASRMLILRPELPERFFLFFASAIATVVFTCVANKARFTSGFLNSGLGVAFSAGYVCLQIVVVLACIAIVCSRSLGTRVVKGMALVLIAIVSGWALAALHYLVHAPRGLANALQTYLILYCLPMISLVGASAACAELLVLICNHLYERVSAGRPAAASDVTARVNEVTPGGLSKSRSCASPY
ncbi:hypothetical protein NLM27_26975 [Bradyrhizobium sp. CCGB12]|uniref:hypothetical protein n=1 Tax=Bradyrhizobium sp. CCGB12 TaxID=2949632 RepID=UPI0020B2FC16|nr:hypothetical protein [Bradyrhizobium sp. CCGB12]MCP3392393.1 hypothetical protein [Bradyrhizobium sp. CCGB12]